MAKLIAPAGAPPFFQGFILQIERFFTPLVPTSPIGLKSYDIGSLPNAAAYPDCIILVKNGSDINIGISNGNDWINSSNGVPF